MKSCGASNDLCFFLVNQATIGSHSSKVQRYVPRILCNTIANIMKRQSKIRIATWKNESRFVSWPYDILCYALTLESKLQNLQKKHIIYVSRYVSHRDDHMEISILSWEKCVVAPLHNGLSPVWRQAITLTNAVCCNLGLPASYTHQTTCEYFQHT